MRMVIGTAVERQQAANAAARVQQPQAAASVMHGACRCYSTSQAAMRVGHVTQSN
jgi:hypothetical protein